MIRIGTACFTFSDQICVLWNATFNFWEFIATVIATGAVTTLTIYWSVRVSREATTQQLAAAADAARLERQNRAAASEAEARRLSLDSRTRLAQSMIRVAHQLEDAVDDNPRSPRRGAANAEWAALRVAFETSAEPNASQLYEFADITISRASEPTEKADKQSQRPTEFVQDLLRKKFGNDLAVLARRWVTDPHSTPDPSALSALREKWAAEQKLKNERFMRLMTEFLEPPEPAQETDIFAEKQDDPRTH